MTSEAHEAARDEIAALEEELDDLAQRVDRAERLMLVTRAAMIAAGVALLLLLFGAFGRSALVLLLSLAVLLGGAALFGSTRSTSLHLKAAIRSKTERRAALIEAIGPRFVGAAETSPPLVR
jgi:uncharacterized membrane protein YjjP (DUF1212 family)